MGARNYPIWRSQVCGAGVARRKIMGMEIGINGFCYFLFQFPQLIQRKKYYNCLRL